MRITMVRQIRCGGLHRLRKIISITRATRLNLSSRLTYNNPRPRSSGTRAALPRCSREQCSTLGCRVWGRARATQALDKACTHQSSNRHPDSSCRRTRAMGRPPLSPGPTRRPHPVLAGGQIQARKTTLPGGSRRDDPRKSTGQLQFRPEGFLLGSNDIVLLIPWSPTYASGKTPGRKNSGPLSGWDTSLFFPRRLHTMCDSLSQVGYRGVEGRFATHIQGVHIFRLLFDCTGLGFALDRSRELAANDFDFSFRGTTNPLQQHFSAYTQLIPPVQDFPFCSSRLPIFFTYPVLHSLPSEVIEFIYDTLIWKV